MKTTLPLVVALLSAVSFAQDQAPGPAGELKRFERLIGSWQGKGTVRMAPDADPIPWTCQSTYAWTLGKHFVGVDTLIDFGGAMPPLAFRELLGWDRENQRYVAISVGSTGEGTMSELTFADDDTMVSLVKKAHEGKPLAERSVTTLTKDGMRYSMTTMHATGATIEHVTGTFTRAAKETPVATEATAAMMPVAPAMERMHSVVGTYSFAGEMIMMPGQPAMKIHGTDAFESIFGGSVLRMKTTGTAEGSPDRYEAEGYLVWNEPKQCFDAMTADNMGWIGTMEERVVEDKIIATQACSYMGTPMAQRMVLTLDGNGKLASAEAWALTGTAAPYCSFKGTYTVKK